LWNMIGAQTLESDGLCNSEVEETRRKSNIRHRRELSNISMFL